MASTFAAGAGFAAGTTASQAKGVDAQTFLNFSALPPAVQQHLQKVYLTLAACLVVVAAGAYAHLLLNLGGFLSHLGTVGSIMWLSSLTASPANEATRLRLLMATAFFQGCSMGPLVAAVADIDTSLIGTAFVATSAVFLAFSGAAMLAKRREFLYLGGMLGSVLSAMLAMRFASWLFGTHVLQFQMELYLGLVVFVGYVVFDTQVMVERAFAGSNDYVSDALQLLLDFVSIFVRVLIFLARNSDKNERRQREKREGNTKHR